MNYRHFIMMCLLAPLALLTMSTAQAEFDLIKSMPWASSVGINKQEYIEEESIEDGYLSSISLKQSIQFHHAAEEWFDVGLYVKGKYSDGDNLQRYWENLTETSYGLEFSRVFSNSFISWGKASLIIGQVQKDHNDTIGEPFDATLDEIRFEVTTTGDWLN